MSGDTARFNYLVYLSPETKGNKVRFYDKMVLKPDGTVSHTAWVTKFGFPVAKTTVNFRKVDHEIRHKAKNGKKG